MPDSKNTIYREMVLDLLYRLNLADEIFCQATETAMSAISQGNVLGKRETVEQVHSYAKALKVIYADFLHVIEGQHVMFPADVALWQWNEPGGEQTVASTIERLHAIAEGMEMRLNAEIVKMEVLK